MSILWSVPLWCLLTTLGLAVSFLPRWAEMKLGPLLGRAAALFGLFKNRIALANIMLALPELGPKGARRLMELNTEHMGTLFFEYVHLFSPIPGHFRRYIAKNSVLEGVEHWRAARAKGKGVIFFCPHLGFWETMAASAGLAGLEPVIVTKVLKPGWLDAKITACRSSTGTTAAYHPGSITTLLRTLRKGGSICFMNDQYARPPMGLPVNFFGRKVDTLSAVASLAKRTGAAVVPAYGYRDSAGVNRIVIEPELDLGTDLEDIAGATQVVAARVEKWVRRRPEQWLWIHRRFKNSTAALSPA
ncbi:MAG: lysophospholipid acyltransferase family protein [Elusimicrobia bacterium]|nr:lysophospholipid acyltransferase family protein [Elusimicrobiota bacterium]